jgi:putative ABC transport system permease protein
MRTMSALLKKSIVDVTRRKGRSLLVICGIMIAVLGLTAVNSASSTIGNAFAYTQDLSRVPDLAYSTPQTVPSSVSTEIKNNPNIAAIQTCIRYLTRWQTQNSRQLSLQINGYDDFQQIKLGTIQLTSGRLPGPGEIVMDSSDRIFQLVAIGDTVTIEAANGPTPLRVVGLARMAGSGAENAQSQGSNSLTSGYMRASDLLQLTGPFSSSGSFDKTKPRLDTLILLKTRQSSNVEQTAHEVEQVLQSARVNLDQASINDAHGTDQQTVNGMLIVIRDLSLVVLLLTCLLIINTVVILLNEQVKIIGTMKAIGGTRLSVMRSYLITVGIYAVIGTLLGLGLGTAGGYLLASAIASLVTIDLGPFQLSPGVLVISLAVGLAAPLLAALLPLWRGTSISVREAIATYGISMGKSRRVTSGESWLTRIPQTYWLGLRGIFRKPIRAWLTLLALALSAVVFLSVQVATDSINYTVNEALTSYSYDLNVRLGGSPRTLEQFLTSVQSVPNIRSIEPTNSGLLKTSSGELVLTGLEAHTQLYHYHLIAGRWLTNDEPDTVVLSDAAAQKLNVSVGDSLMGQVNGSYQGNWRIVGIIHELAGVQGNSIGSAFTTFENLNTVIYGQPTGRSTEFLVEGQDRTPGAIDQLENQLSAALIKAQVKADISNRLQGFQQVQQTIQFVTVLFYTVTAAVALVGLLGLFNTLSTEVLERRLEIGILRSIGATARRVASVFLIEGLGLAGVAFFVGLLLCLPAAIILVNLLSSSIVLLDFSFDPGSVLVTALFVLVLTFLASVGPALTISRMRIHELLRYE